MQAHIQLLNGLVDLWTNASCATATEVMKALFTKELKALRYPLLRCPDFMVHRSAGCVIPHCAFHGDYPDLLTTVLETAPRVDVEQRLVSLLTLCMSADTPLCQVMDGKFVTAVVRNKFHRVFSKLGVLAVQDVTVLMTSCVRSCLSKPHAEWLKDLETSREVINIMFCLGVIDTYNCLFSVGVSVLKGIIAAVHARTVPEKDIHACLTMMFNLFTMPSVLHKKSVLSMRLASLLVRFPKCIQLMARLDNEKSDNLLKYKHVDMSGALGSRWLRALVVAPQNLDAEERSRGFTAEQALQSRLSNFLRLNKPSTKANIVTAAVDGCNLLEFAIARGCSGDIVGANATDISVSERLGRVLLDAIVYFVTDEDPTVLDPDTYKRCFEAICEKGVHNTYMASVRSLSHRVKATFQDATTMSVPDIMAALRPMVACGFPPECVTLCVCTDKCLLRNHDVRKWRALLKACLLEFPVQLTDTYQVVFENKPLEDFVLVYL
jgi:hypothetical protein